MDIFREFLIAFNPQQNGFFFMWILAGIAFTALLMMVERFLQINRYTNIDASRFVDRLLVLIKDDKLSDAYAFCSSGGVRALPAVLGAGVKRAIEVPDMVANAMEEESLHVLPLLEKRLNLIVTFGNLATLLGLMGTIYGLILAFAAVAQPDVSPVEKSSLLAVGISAAMNTTLLGLVIAVPCVLIYSIFRSRIDETVAEIDRYAVALMKVLIPESGVRKNYRVSDRRIREEVDTEPNIVPFMNLMVVLIPLLLSSSEFVKLGMIELKLPESAAGAGGDGTGEEQKNTKVDLGIVITEKGFNLYHYFKKDSASPGEVEIPKVDGDYDFATLNKKVAEVKRKALYEIIRLAKQDLAKDTELWKLSYLYGKNDLSGVTSFSDHENVKIVADDKIHYQTVVSVMDAARGVTTPNGKVTLFPNVSIAGGIVQ
ncbi:MAG: MotA/TolQ/ExbB proton channel family protein [Chitinispirillaceae bacterium]|nr:MotA/TolQ/ExbB proton channel family protein [Chitinispirillaceae bacterium]